MHRVVFLTRGLMHLHMNKVKIRELLYRRQTTVTLLLLVQWRRCLHIYIYIRIYIYIYIYIYILLIINKSHWQYRIPWFYPSSMCRSPKENLPYELVLASPGPFSSQTCIYDRCAAHFKLRVKSHCTQTSEWWSVYNLNSPKAQFHSSIV